MGAPVTILGNVAVDRVDGGAPRPGGCPSFAAPLLRVSRGSIVTRCAPADLPLFAPVLAVCRATILESVATAAFEIVNHGDDRTMLVVRTGDRWRPSDLEEVAIEPWVHVAPLLEGDVGADTLGWLRRRGHRLAFDGQGLVRRRATGALQLEAHLDPVLLGMIDVLKLSAAEAAIVDPGFDAGTARALGVPEVIVTHGVRGAVVYLDGEAHHVTPPSIVDVTDATGAGDTFMVSYVGSRAAGADPVHAAALAAHAVVRALETRARSAT